MVEKAPPGWWFFVQCRSCNGDIIFQKAPSPEEEERPKVQGVTVTCPHCQTAGTYEPREVMRGEVEP